MYSRQYAILQLRQSCNVVIPQFCVSFKLQWAISSILQLWNGINSEIPHSSQRNESVIPVATKRRTNESEMRRIREAAIL